VGGAQHRAPGPRARLAPDFRLSDLLDRGTATIDRVETCRPLSLFTLVEVRN
jgi:hypothetical protein